MTMRRPGLLGALGAIAAMPLMWAACGGEEFSSSAPGTGGADASAAGAAGTAGAGGSGGSSAGSGGTAGASSGGSAGQGGTAGASSGGSAGQGGSAGGAAGAGGVSPCGDLACAPPPDGGWSGWVLVDWVAKTQAGSDACPAESILRWDPADVPLPTCSCACGAPSNMTCQVDTACGPGNGDCTTAYHGVAGPACSVATLEAQNTTCAAGALRAVGSCSAKVEGTASPAAPTVRSCVLTAHKSCGDDSFCATKPPDDGSGPCISAAGVMDCPANYPNKQVAYDSFVDERQCVLGSCKCLPTTGSCVVVGNPAGVQARVGGCGAASFVQIPLGAVCTAIPNTGGAGSSVVVGMTLVGTSYSPGSALPCQDTGTPGIVGDAHGESPVTICCMQ